MILFVGPLPPPLHGFSFVNSQMLARFRGLSPVTVFDRAGRSGRGFAVVARFWSALTRKSHAGSIYLGLSGGYGQLLDLFYLIAARLGGRQVVVHHHSYAYLREHRWYTGWCLAHVPTARHIVLSDGMARALATTYGIPPASVDVVSNAAFLPAPVARASDFVTTSPAPLRMGFLSNITAEKGIFLFLALGAALHARGIAVIGVIAGPVAADVADRLAESLADNAWCRHVGPLYGNAKEVFFHQQIDVLVFPTLYVNEAEPVTILEALRAGVPVIANQRGCVRERVPAAAGAVFEDDARFVELATECLAGWLREPPTRWQARRVAALAAFVELQAEHTIRLDVISRRLAASDAGRA